MLRQLLDAVGVRPSICSLGPHVERRSPVKVNFAHLCDYALVADGKLSVMGIFDRISAFKLPWSHPTAYLAFELGLEPPEVGTDFSVRIQVRDQDGKTLIEADGQLKSGGRAKIGDRPKVKQVLCINGLTFERPGPYEVVIWLNEKLEESLPFDVVLREQKLLASDHG